MSKLVPTLFAGALLALAAPALAAPSSPRLSAEGWKTYRSFQALAAADVDMRHARRAHAQLQRFSAGCVRLPGHGTQSSGIRAVCGDSARLLDRFVVAQICTDAAGGGAASEGLCLLSALPQINRDLARGGRASGTVAATLAPGRCRTAFAGQEASWAAAAQRGRAFLRTAESGDADAVEAAAERWEAAMRVALEHPLGDGGRGCRPR